MPANPLLTDPAYQFQPWLLHARSEVRAGRLPLWNPHAYTGSPLLANAQSAVLSPFTAPAYLFPVPFALALAALAKLAIAGLSTHAFLRLLGLRRLAAVTGALSFMFSGFLVVWLGHPHSAVMVWLPALFACIEWLRQGGGRWALGATAVGVALQFLGGHPQTSLHVLTAAGLYALYRAAGPGASRFLLRLGAAGLTGLLLAAVQLLPFLEYLQRSAVYFYRQRWEVGHGLEARAWVAWLVPRYFGSPVDGPWWGPDNYNEISGYVGVVALLLLPWRGSRAAGRAGRRALLLGAAARDSPARVRLHAVAVPAGTAPRLRRRGEPSPDRSPRLRAGGPRRPRDAAARRPGRGAFPPNARGGRLRGGARPGSHTPARAGFGADLRAEPRRGPGRRGRRLRDAVRRGGDPAPARVCVTGSTARSVRA